MAAQVISLRVGEAPTGILADLSGDDASRIGEATNRIECLGSMAYALSLNPELAPYMADALRGLWSMAGDVQALLIAGPAHGVAA